MTSAIRRLYFASNLTPDLGLLLPKALDEAGFGQILSVEELTFQGSWGKVELSNSSLEKIPQVEYLMADPDIIALVFQHPACSLVWAQSTNAGVDIFFRRTEKIQKTPNFLMTRHFEGFGQLMAEYVLSTVLFRERRLGSIYDLQKEKKVPVFGGMLSSLRMTVWAAVRDERYSSQKATGFEHTDHVRPISRLSEMLESCDYVVNILPSAPGTIGLLSGDVLKPCEKKEWETPKVCRCFANLELSPSFKYDNKQKSVFINVGRGNVIDDESLINALKSGWLGGAILDVFNQEPLPPSSELWTLPGVIITPHYSATTLSGKKRSTDSFIHNLKCYVEGKPLKCVVDFNKGY